MVRGRSHPPSEKEMPAAQNGTMECRLPGEVAFWDREIEEAEFFLSMLTSWTEGVGEARKKSRILVLTVSPRC